ncbi:ParA family protein [Cupriavidus basilensis]|uniref:ParA family protein n=1 Tax=Cupriavidus basilensis TaxID=68895 RepID=UPI0023E827BA|nr:AAA family ATPase [Cupriavidus basilensis]MDF3883649.1 AAA family ATPase [Cupriavidus basilensis]
MSTFDQILPALSEVLHAQAENLKRLGPIVVNRDLNGRVRLVIDESVRDGAEARVALDAIAEALAERLGPHGFPVDRMVLFESDVPALAQGAPHFQLEGIDGVTVVDRLATDTDWAAIAPVALGAPRIVFFSIKGGVGRSTGLAVAAWSLAQAGKRVLVLDLDLESPGLSSSLLPEERRPIYGIADWLVEDLVDNCAAVFESMVATSDLSHDGEIYVVPAHGRDPGEYVAKLGRVWMSKVGADGVREPWSKRLHRLLADLEQRWQPDVILIDSRAGIDEVASACITDLGAHGVLLFAIDGEQTWSGYRILFRHWHRAGVARDIRERLQLVGAMIPDVDGIEYFDGLREAAWDAFAEELYDEVPAGEPTGERFSFDEADEGAPHYPWPIRWHRGFAALRSIHSRFQRIDPDEVTAIFGSLVDGVHAIAEGEGERHV